MKRVSWKWVLPIAQLALALGCFVCDTHEYRIKARLDGAVDNPWYSAQHYPAWPGRMLDGINFPALVSVYPLEHFLEPIIYERNTDYTLILVYPRDVCFFIAIVVFWGWVGWRVDGHLRRPPAGDWPGVARITGSWSGAVFGVLSGVYAVSLIARGWIPTEEIGACGLVWSFALTTYFARKLRKERRTPGMNV